MEKLENEQEILNWHNKDNNAFYETVNVEGLKELAEKGGLASGCDIKALEPYWSKAQSILEVGAGYGRVIDYLLKHQFKGTITAVERSNVLFKSLGERFAQHENVYLLHRDVLDLDDIGSFDLIFLLWGCCANFPPNEQSLVFKKLSRLLEPNGKLIVDTVFADSLPLGATEIRNRHYLINTHGSFMNFHLPNIMEINHYAQSVGFSNISHINYKTDNNRNRRLYILDRVLPLFV